MQTILPTGPNVATWTVVGNRVAGRDPIVTRCGIRSPGANPVTITIARHDPLTSIAGGAAGGRMQGRKPIPFDRRDRVAHRRRPALPRNCPLHVTIRLVEGLPRLRGARTWRYVRRCIALAHKPGFRVVHFSMLDDHLHFIVEADDQLAGARHAGPRHSAQRGRTMPSDWVDPFSSAPHFDGWAIETCTNLGLCGPPVTMPPRSRLLRVGWSKDGPLHPGVVPGGAHWGGSEPPKGSHPKSPRSRQGHFGPGEGMTCAGCVG